MKRHHELAQSRGWMARYAELLQTRDRPATDIAALQQAAIGHAETAARAAREPFDPDEALRNFELGYVNNRM